jgi:hypothetical protein
MELQFYPPGFSSAISCDNGHWCSALNIDSLECTRNFTCNPQLHRRRSTSPTSQTTVFRPVRPARSCPTGRRSRQTLTRF